MIKKVSKLFWFLEFLLDVISIGILTTLGNICYELRFYRLFKIIDFAENKIWINMLRIARFLGVTIEHLKEGLTKMNVNKDAIDLCLSDFEKYT